MEGKLRDEALCREYNVASLPLCLNSQTRSRVTFDRYVIPRPRTTPPLHYDPNIDDTKNGVVVLVPNNLAPNGYGVVFIDSGGFVSHKQAYWLDDRRLNQWQVFLRRGYTVFIVTHPKSSFFDVQQTPPTPGYIVPEIQSFIATSLLQIKLFTLPGGGSPITNPASDGSYGLMGGSSGGTLALTFAYEPNKKVDPTTGIKVGFGAVGVFSPGTDIRNWRFPGDYSWIWRNCTGLVHTPLPGYPVPPDPASLTLPDYYPPSAQFVFPNDMTPIDAALEGTPNTAFLPETYLHFYDGGVDMQGNPTTSANLFGIWNLEGGLVRTGPPFGVLFGFTAVPASGVPGMFLTHQAGNMPLVNQIYPYLPADWTTYTTGVSVVDHMDATDPPTIYFFGDKDSVVVPYQAQRFRDVYQQVHNGASFLNQYPRAGAVHGWRDLDYKDSEAIANFFDEKLRGIVDRDDDGLSDTLEVNVGLNSRDSDGDGQPDGNEYIHQGSTGPALAGDDLDNPGRTFRIHSISRSLYGFGGSSGTTSFDTWYIDIVFEGRVGLTNPQNFYEVQVTNWLLKDDPDGPKRLYAPWRKPQAAVTFSVVPGPGNNLYKASILRPVNAPADDKFYRIAFVPPGSGAQAARQVATAPVGVEKLRMKRRTTDVTVNLICSPFLNGDEWRGKITTISSNTAGTTFTWSPAAGVTLPALSPLGGSTATLVGPSEYYAIVQQDESIASKRPGLAPQPAPNPTVRTVTPHPEDEGMMGHWWFLNGSLTAGNSITMSNRDVPTKGQNLPPGSSVAIRRLINLADIFHGLEAPNAPLQWLSAQDQVTVNGSPVFAPSPFLPQDKIRFLARESASVDWSINNSFLPSEKAALVTLEFRRNVDPSGNIQPYGYWFDVDDPNMTPVDLRDYRLRPDEAFEYVAVATSDGADHPYWVSGHVPVADMYAYVKIDAKDRGDGDPVNHVPVFWYPDPNPGPQTNVDLAYYGMSSVGWPFPVDCDLVTEDVQTTGFFESGLTLSPEQGSLSGLLPPATIPGALLLHTNPEDALYVDDVPENSTAVWGDDDGHYSYWAYTMPHIRTISMKGGTKVKTNNIDGGGTAFRPAISLRGGRGYTILMNRDQSDPRTLKSWRMRRPYRRP